ncbi:hypothetical protein Btru_024405 [Bulinus truncatus]|nr:hypothetical protein Btru_024405 [Bulinus truncatus]
MRACIKTLVHVKSSNILPVLLCQECQHQFMFVRSRLFNHLANNLISFKSTSRRISYNEFPGAGLSGQHKHISRHICTSHKKMSSSDKPPEAKTDLSAKVASNPIQTQTAKLNTAGQPILNLDKKPESTPSSAESADSSSPEDRKKNKVLSVIPRMRKPNPIDYSYTGNIYILPSRALMEYLLKPSDLIDLPKYTRRSPYESGARITLYLRTDVEEVALKKWGDFDKLNKEKAKLRYVDHVKSYDITDLRRLLGEIHSSGDFANPDDPNAQTLNDGSTPPVDHSEPKFWQSGSAKVILSAIFVYGYRNLRHISSLISGVGIFFFGTGLSYYHSLQGFIHPVELGNLTWCVATLFGSLISESATLIIAVNQVRKSSKALNIGFKEYLLRGIDPNVNVVLLEDLAAVIGVGIAGVCISISALTGSSFADATGSFLIGTLLGSVAAFIVHQNTHQLVGRSIPESERQEISQLLERDRMIRSLHDIKATQMGGVVRYKAEVDFDGKEITRAYLYKQDLDQLLLEAQNLKTVEDLETFMMNHGEKIIDALGAEVDRIEKSLKSKHPEIRHVDLEAL